VTRAELEAVALALGKLTLAIDALESEGAPKALADEARTHLGGLALTLDRMSQGAVPSPPRPSAEVISLAARRRQQKGGAR
jgi:hypothetical protein